jgi:peptide/nickel transport system ATP-binding protein
VVDLHKRFGSFEAVRGVSLSIGLGESVGIVGESGSGKTTIARCLVGLEEPSAGNISIANIDASSYRHATTQQRRALRGLVQIIFQDPYSSLNPLMTVGAALKEAIAAGSKVQSTRRTDVPQLLDRVGLPTNYANRRPVALSGGERQRVAIARALALQPRLIICDEPVSALDVSVQAQILNLFRELRSELEVSYLFITHDLAVVRQVADRLYVLQAGSVVEEGSVETVLSSPATPYTRRLVQSVPRSDHAWLDSRAGDVSTPIPT